MIPTIILTMTVTFCNLQHENEKNPQKTASCEEKKYYKNVFRQINMRPNQFQICKKVFTFQIGNLIQIILFTKKA